MHHVKVEFDYKDGVLSVSRLDIDLIDYLADENGKYFQEFKGLDLARHLDFWDRLTAQVRACVADGNDEFFFDIDDPFNPFAYPFFYGEIIDGSIYSYTGWKPEYNETSVEAGSDNKSEKMEERVISELIAPAADAGCTFAQLLMGDYYDNYDSGSEISHSYYRKAAEGGLISCFYRSVLLIWWEPGFTFNFEAFQT